MFRRSREVMKMLHPRSGVTVCSEKNNFMGKTKVQFMLTAQPKPLTDPILESAVLTLCKKADEKRSCLFAELLENLSWIC